MSVDLTVYLSRSTMPSPDRWAQGIREAGFPADLDADFDVDTSSGFVPCTYEGKPGGFEYFARPLAEEDRDELGVSAAHDFSVTLATHSEMRGLATSIVAAAVLCQITGGTLVDQQAGEQFAASEALGYAREMLESMHLE
jgi:hypothetical protein